MNLRVFIKNFRLTRTQLIFLNILLLMPILIILGVVIYGIATKESRYSQYEFDRNKPITQEWEKFEIKELIDKNAQFETLVNLFEVIDNIHSYSYTIGGRSVSAELKSDYNTDYKYLYNLRSGELVEVVISQNEEYVNNNDKWIKLDTEISLDISEDTTLLFILETLPEALNTNTQEYIGEYNGLINCDSENQCHSFKYVTSNGSFKDEFQVTLEIDAKYLRPVKFNIEGYEFNFEYQTSNIASPKTYSSLNQEESIEIKSEICQKLAAEQSYPEEPCGKLL